jgi:UDP-N-acetylglucosamine diphosphorylase/glucosamine-1-phosphate N-acetyltransferase
VKLHLFDDREADGWAPFALSRPVSELRFGTLLLRERLERFAGRPADGLLTRPWLSAYGEAGAPPAATLRALPDDEDRLLLSSRLVPDDGARFEPPEGPALLRADGRPAGCWLPAGHPTPGAGWTERPAPLPGAGEASVEGRLLAGVWEIVRDGMERTADDVGLLAPGDARVGAGELPEGVTRDGGGALYLEEGVRLEPGVHLDLRAGPVWLGPGVEVRSGARLAGPLHAGRDSRLLGGPLGPLSTGPVSKLRGEVAETTTLGWVNKAHAGHLGHALLGRWVNLGAGTTNSDLKNNYGPVRLAGPEGERETGLLKLGCLLGDHVRTAIGTLLPTGAAVGAGANVFGPVRPPKWVPPFAWGTGPGAGVYRKDAFLETAETVMGRRGVEMGPGAREWLSAVWDEARGRGEGGGA